MSTDHHQNQNQNHLNHHQNQNKVLWTLLIPLLAADQTLLAARVHDNQVPLLAADIVSVSPLVTCGGC